MRNLVLTAAILDGMNRHNRMTREALRHDRIILTDHCGNVFTLNVWVTAERKARYLLECRNTPHAESNIFRAPLPQDPTVFDDHEDFLAAVAATPNVAKTVEIQEQG